ncbi:uncharacterized protein [Haliotis asinina]|uniref:uncharacterized protein n=1 Tax=Haliotis asinina TaxID=109174 RepID=UPI0035323875
MNVRSLVFLLPVVCSDVIIYPAPDGVAPSDKFSVNVTQSGQPPSRLFVYISTSDHRSSSPLEPPGRSMSWTSFAFTGAPVTIDVHSPKDFNNCLVRPSSYGYRCERQGPNRASFTILQNARMMSVEFDNDYGLGIRDITDKLFVFADPPEVNVPSPTDSDVLYYGAGIHNFTASLVVGQEIREVYISPGAYIRGGFQLPHGNVTMHGRGVISNENFVRHDERIGQCAVNFMGSSGNVYEGITIADPSKFFFLANGHDNIVRNARMVAAWMGNTDGIGVGIGGLVEDTFIIADDANIKIHMSNLTVRRCVQWQMQNGGTLQTGWETLYVRNVTMADMDIIHTDWCKFKNVCKTLSGNDAVFDTYGNTRHFDVSDIRFENIRVEGSCPRIVNYNMDPAAEGIISNVTVVNLSVDSQPAHDPIHTVISGSSRGGRIINWRFVNLTIAGQCIPRGSDGDFIIDHNTTSDITFTC